jgi:cytochrome o ubiquinol oxidase operon protein cyoD
MAENMKKQLPTNSHPGSVRSYVIGFALSLLFTIIPYYMVRLQIITSTPLFLAILGFAVIQMGVQIFFFLHLGRGPKPFYNIVFFAATAGMIVLVIGASLIIMANLYHNMSPEEYTTRLAQDENIAEVDGRSTGACQGTNANHMVMIKNSQVNPQHTDAHRCDMLVFMSDDNASHTFNFGSETNPISYGGIFEVAITGTQSKAITLNQTGDFSFYDHSNHSAIGSFTVKP